MPIYEFRCNHCGQRFSEFFRSMSSAAEGVKPPCPHCASEDTVRVVSSFAVHGPAGPDPGEVAAERKAAEREASITPREQIDKWRKAKGKK